MIRQFLAGENNKPARIGFSFAIVAAIIIGFMVFAPPYLGIADDGSFEGITNQVGISHLETEESTYFDYYTRTYKSLQTQIKPHFLSSHLGAIKLAKGLDDYITKDYFFDMRFMALVYFIPLIIAIGLVITEAVRGCQQLLEAILIGVGGLIIFSDIAYATYLPSFYIEPIVMITFMLCIASVMGIGAQKHVWGYLLLYTLAGTLFILTRKDGIVLGVCLGILAIRMIFSKADTWFRIGCVGSASIIFISVMISAFYMESPYDLTSKYHAMTRGPLLQSENPKETLEEFGINASYTILAQNSLYETYPLTPADNKVLQEEFYAHYNTPKLLQYYIKHPKQLMRMMDLGVRASFDVRKDFLGNYEKRVGMQPKAKSIFWSIWSSFKLRSAPKTVFFMLGMILIFVYCEERYRRKGQYRIQGYFEILAILTGAALLYVFNVILFSGDAQLGAYTFPMTIIIDCVFYYALAIAINQLKIIHIGEEN